VSIGFGFQSVATRERRHGLRYSLTLHGPGGDRLVGFDNAHSVPASKSLGGKGRGGVLKQKGVI
jgi:hypothetical protein